MFLNIENNSPNKLALVDDNSNYYTYGELLGYSASIANLSLPRSVVFCLCNNSVDAVAGYLSLLQSGLVPLLIDAKIDRQFLTALLKIYQPSYLWLPDSLDVEGNYKVLFQKGNYTLCKSIYPPYSIHGDLGLLLSTSGSTGSPKLVRHSINNLEFSAKQVAKIFQFTSEERSLACLPMQYTMGLSVINSTLSAGATVLITNLSLADARFWSFFKENEATNFTGVTYSYDILDKLRFTNMSLPHLQTIAQGGGKLTRTMFNKLADYANNNGKRFYATYGQTECSARMTYLPPEKALDKCLSIGIAIPGGELFLVNDNGVTLDETEACGEMGYRGDNVTMGYAVCKEDLMKGDEWKGEILTGDIAQRDTDGFYYIVGRKNRFLKLFGLRISLDQCEQILISELSLECACAGDDNEMQIYVTKGNPNEISKLLSYKTGLPISSFNVIHTEKLPRNENGKINYYLLKSNHS